MICECGEQYDKHLFVDEEGRLRYINGQHTPSVTNRSARTSIHKDTSRNHLTVDAAGSLKVHTTRGARGNTCITDA
jgi:hypothetical protein